MWSNSCTVRGPASTPCLKLSSPEGEGLELHVHSLIWSNSCALRGPASTPCLTLSSPEGEGLGRLACSQSYCACLNQGCGSGSGICFSLQCGSGSGSCSASRWCESATTGLRILQASILSHLERPWLNIESRQLLNFDSNVDSDAVSKNNADQDPKPCHSNWYWVNQEVSRFRLMIRFPFGLSYANIC